MGSVTGVGYSSIPHTPITAISSAYDEFVVVDTLYTSAINIQAFELYGAQAGWLYIRVCLLFLTLTRYTTKLYSNVQI